MGILISRFRKKKTTIEILEDLDSKIKEIQQYGQTTEQRHKKIVGTLIIYSVILYVVTAVLFYFYFFPAALYDQLFYIIPLLIFPLLIVFTKKLVTWYYKRKISRNQEKLSTMQEQKKKILEDVTETETYKKAKEILLKFAPDQLRMTPLTPQLASKVITSPVSTPRRPSTPQAVVPPLPGGGELRRRALTLSSPQDNSSVGRGFSGTVPVGVAPSGTPPVSSLPSRPQNPAIMGPRSPLPRPILPQQRSYLDRLVEYLVGDGPSNRYALICHQCDSHNGMALKEEFEYFGFRCCYCNYWNPARKQKPSAPKLETEAASPFSSPLSSQKPSDIEASSSSGTDSDIEVVEKPETPEIPDDKVADAFSQQSDESKVEEVTAEAEEEKEEKSVEEVQSEQMEVDDSTKE
ncbi:endoplasmic reticulum junction formation protein lunapark-A isoform X1 [Diachasma alloeum]|uniref:endoplasmic reticulum junction formation protein lunapark-A isoform X1 n=1 Tax=Diachasma alloeum TaxID=454923 RepID=UPI00073828A4|nr:endoplasmic reticulum junction formation protein lunapark-A isoform X1 [Diachasma alloeum]